MKGELASETLNYDTKTKCQSESKCNLLRTTLQVKQQVSEAEAVSQVFKNLVNSAGKHLFESLSLQLY